ncbi:MAG: RHS repeat-associated core domain-containing protein, partial [Sphingomicrobium sp.]
MSANYNTSTSPSTVAIVNDGAGTWSYSKSSSSGITTTSVTDPNGQVSSATLQEYAGINDKMTSYKDPLGRTTSYTFDSFGRLLTMTRPNGDETKFAYDSETQSATRGNLVSVTRVPVAGSGLSNTITSYSYDSVCNYPAKCNEPNSISDNNGNTTNYTYDNTYGVVLKIDPPAAAAGGINPEIRYSYTALYAYYKNSSGQIVRSSLPVYLKTGISTCQTLANSSCVGTQDEVKTTLVYGSSGVANNLLQTSKSIGAGDGTLTATTGSTYDIYGNIASTTEPLGQTTVYLYDADRERTGIIDPNPGASEGLPYPATRTQYTPDGLIQEVDRGVDTSQADTNWSTFTSQQQAVTTYDSLDRPIEKTVSAGGTTYSVTQYSYDPVSRLTCTAVRMNPSAFQTLPTSACALGTQGSDGPDRITENVYDAAGQIVQVRTAVGTNNEEALATYVYGPNGEENDVIDADGNHAQFVYDGFDRRAKWIFPSSTAPSSYNDSSQATALATAGAADTNNYEAYTYDANDNRTSLRKRDGQIISYGYDALNRVSSKAVPGGHNVTYGYDLLGRQTNALFTDTGEGIRNNFDALGRMVSSTTTMGGASRTISYQFDVDNNRTTITHPDGQAFKYTYDMLDRMTALYQGSSTPLDTFVFNSDQTIASRIEGAVASPT